MFCYFEYIVAVSCFYGAMEFILDFCRDFGYSGMMLISFLSGTVLPFSSDVLLVFFLGVGLDPIWLLLAATLGNTIGSMTCYYIGRMGKKGWLTDLFKVSPEKSEKASVYIDKYGYWAAFFSFMAIVGEAIVIVLGNMRVSWWKVLMTMTLGKFLRYLIIVLSYEGVVGII